MSWQAPGYAHRLELGGGKTGRAFLAANEESGELVVIKYLSVETTYVGQIRTELSELSTLDSQHFAAVREVIETDEGVAVVMAPVNGVPLRALLRDVGALTAEASLLILHETLTGLVAAHAAGVVHGDYRPENVMIDITGSSVMLDARAAGWIDRDVSLGTGVYLAPERWRSGTLTAGADIYAAAVTFAEMLVGEPPYWEDSQLLTLRYRHEHEEIPVEGIPVALRDIVRLGMAKDAGARADADALLAVVDVTAIAEYGPDWADAGRAALVALLSERQLAFGAVEVIEETSAVAAGELVELDDYYVDAQAAEGVAAEGMAAEGVAAEDIASEGVAAEGVAAENAGAEELADAQVEAVELAAAQAQPVEEISESEVVAAAAEIVELARIEEMTVAEASAEEDVLTEEEEQAVAEVENLVAAVEQSIAVGTVAVEGTQIAATESELAEIETAIEGAGAAGAVFESEFAEGAFAEGGVAEGLIAEGAAASGAGAAFAATSGAAASGATASGVAASSAQSGGIATGVAKVSPQPVAVATAAIPLRRRHPRLIAAIAILFVIIVAGTAFGLTGGLSGGPSAPSTPQAAITESSTLPGVVPPASASATPAQSGGTSTTESTGPRSSPTPGAPATSSTRATHKPKPTPTPTKLPVTGSSTGYTFGLAGLLLAVGTVLVVVARRRRA